MHDKDIFARILGIQLPWRVTDVTLRIEAGEVPVEVAAESAALRCPTCQGAAPGYDTRTRQWRHLDICQHGTIVKAQVPRVRCATHGVSQVLVPWAENGSRFTALFEALVIDWMQAASVTAVSLRLRLSWDGVDGIMSRAVASGLVRRHVPSWRW